jgi:hypothetical protein
MMLLLCKPIIVPPAFVGTEECRIVMARPTGKPSVYEVEIQDAPPISVNYNSFESISLRRSATL